jgi:tRNA pseudouridine38-40 synthase
MVRFLVGTMVEVAAGRRPAGTVARLLTAADNRDTAPPAPPHGLSLRAVTYPVASYAASFAAGAPPAAWAPEGADASPT